MITHFKGNVPFITKDQMIEIDNMMAEKYNIDLFQMMENAGHSLAMLARDKFLKKIREKEIVVFAGSGGNGGAALVASRRLRNWGFQVKIVLVANEKKLKPVTKRQFAIAQQMQIPFVNSIGPNTGLIIDGILGYGLNGAPKGQYAKHIKMINDSGVPVLSLDCPSGLDLDNGKPSNPTVKAVATMTIGIAKKGLFKMAGAKYIGDIYVADIGIPPDVYEQFGVTKENIENIFTDDSVARINRLVVFG